MGDDRAGVYVEGRRGAEKVIYRASYSGECIRAMVALWNGMNEARGEARETMLMEAAEAGNRYEEAVVEWLTEQGFVFETRQSTVEINAFGNVWLRGHTDGIAHPPADAKTHPWYKGIKTETVLVEVKSMSANQYKKWMARKTGGFASFFKYACQISTYMEGNPGRDVLYVVVERDTDDGNGGLKIVRTPYEQVVWAAKNGKLNISIIPANKPPIEFKEVKKRILKVESYRKRPGMELPSCDINDRWFCPFWYLHEEEETYVSADELTDEMLALIAEILEKRAPLSEKVKEGKQAEDERRKLDKELLNLMGEVDQTGIVGEGADYLVTVVQYEGEKPNKDKMRQELGDEAEKYIDKYPVKYVKVTAKDKTGE